LPFFYLGILLLTGCSGSGGSSNAGTADADSTDEHVSSGEHIPLAGLRDLPVETFKLSANTGGTFRTKGGLLVYFPPRCVLAENGNPIEEDVRINIRQAYTPARWVEAGIGTASFGYPCEAMGVFMLEIRGIKGTKSKYSIDPKLGYYVSVPEEGHKLTGWVPGQSVPVTRAQHRITPARWEVYTGFWDSEGHVLNWKQLDNRETHRPGKAAQRRLDSLNALGVNLAEDSVRRYTILREIVNRIDATLAEPRRLKFATAEEASRHEFSERELLFDKVREAAPIIPYVRDGETSKKPIKLDRDLVFQIGTEVYGRVFSTDDPSVEARGTVVISVYSGTDAASRAKPKVYRLTDLTTDLKTYREFVEHYEARPVQEAAVRALEAPVTESRFLTRISRLGWFAVARPIPGRKIKLEGKVLTSEGQPIDSARAYLITYAPPYAVQSVWVKSGVLSTTWIAGKSFELYIEGPDKQAFNAQHLEFASSNTKLEYRLGTVEPRKIRERLLSL
jgi:hypothetical protein